MQRIKIVRRPISQAPPEFLDALIGLEFQAKIIRAPNKDAPNTGGWSWEVDTADIAKALQEAGHKEAARFYWRQNPFPALQWMGLCFNLDACEPQ